MNSTNDMNGMDMETKDNNDKKMNENTNVNNNPGSTRLFGGAGGAGRFGANRGPGKINMPGKDKKPGNPIRNGIEKFKGSGRFFGLVILALIVFFTIEGGFYRVDEQETAVVTMFGNVIRTDTAGLYFKIPWIQQVTKVDTTIHGTGIGYAVNDDGQSFTVDTEGIMITSDFNLIDIDFYMEYRVSDPVAYLFNSKQPEYILKNVALAAIRSTVIDFTVDDAMTTGKAQIQSLVKQKMQTELTEQNIGLQVVNITVQDAEPPTDEIVRAFKAVETAKQGKDTANAEAQKAARIAEAEGQVARFNAMYKEYANNPLITKQRLFYETMEDVLPDLKVIINDGNTQTMYPIESFTAPALTGDTKEN